MKGKFLPFWAKKLGSKWRVTSAAMTEYGTPWSSALWQKYAESPLADPPRRVGETAFRHIARATSAALVFTPLNCEPPQKAKSKIAQKPSPSQLVHSVLASLRSCQAFGEAAVHWGEEVAGLADLALIAPQLGGHSRAQL